MLVQFNRALFLATALLWADGEGVAWEKPAPRIYSNQLKRLIDPPPLLDDYPAFIQPIEEFRRFEAPRLIDDPSADLSVRAWRFSYNARGIIEVPNRLSARKTAIITVHPWGIDDGQGWRTPEPAGLASAPTFSASARSTDRGPPIIGLRSGPVTVCRSGSPRPGSVARR